MRFILCFALILAGYFTVQSQVIDENNGKTYYYYDSISHKKVKEIFHHIQEYRFFYDKDGNTIDTLVFIKNGPYTRYHENGKLACSGYYKRDRKTGTWKYYSTSGTLIKTEEWLDGNLKQ